MSCTQSEWLHGYFDSELDAARAAEFESHLPTCPDCARALATQQRLREALASADLYARSPAALRDRVRRAIPWPRRARFWSGLGVAAALLVALGLWRVPGWREDVGDRQVASGVLDAHLRSLQLTHLVDIESSDQHTVKPWFVGKLDFSPPVVDLASEGFPLVGGRLDVAMGRSVAALVYARRKHVIGVFLWPSSEADVPPRSGAERGYHWIHWTRGQMRYWAVSDVAVPELDEFVRLLSRS